MYIHVNLHVALDTGTYIVLLKVASGPSSKVTL